MRLRLAIAIALVATGLSCIGQDAQQSAGQDTPQTATPPVKPQARKTPVESAGTVTGAVYCADTNLPARLTSVYLLAVQGSKSTENNQTTITDLEGRFLIENVPEGKYYVVAVQPGYLDMLRVFNEFARQTPDPDNLKAFEAMASTVEISATQSAEVSVRLERAPEIDGTVRYDDGSPAVAVSIVARRKSAHPDQDASYSIADADALRFEDALAPIKTDDRGQFRILGVAPGEYLVSTSLSVGSAEVGDVLNTEIGELRVFSGSTFRASNADSVKISSGDSLVDADITIPLSKLHTIRGLVSLKSTGQPAPFALVRLLFADTKEQVQTAYVHDGVFEIRHVPEDSYIIQAIARAEPLPEPDGADQANYMAPVPQMITDVFAAAAPNVNSNANADPNTGTAQLPASPSDTPLVVTGDMDNIIVAVADPKPQPAPSGDVGSAAASSSDSAPAPETAPPDNASPTDSSK